MYGVSADTRWTQLAVIENYGMALDSGLLAGIAGRTVFVIDEDGTSRIGEKATDCANSRT